MWAKLQPWQLLQLQRMAMRDSERLETIMNTVWASYPGLYAEMAIAAHDQGQLSLEECASLLEMTEIEVSEALLQFRKRSVPIEAAVILASGSRVAKIASGQVAVWEVVREFRKLGSAERLKDSFPSLSEGELAAALRYAQENPAEIENLIEEYELLTFKRRA